MSFVENGGKKFESYYEKGTKEFIIHINVQSTRSTWIISETREKLELSDQESKVRAEIFL